MSPRAGAGAARRPARSRVMGLRPASAGTRGSRRGVAVGCPHLWSFMSDINASTKHSIPLTFEHTAQMSDHTVVEFTPPVGESARNVFGVTH